jgi:hypothetical protein
MAGTILDESTIPVIRGRFEGDLLEPGDEGYDEARTVFNAMIDRRPRLIVRCTGAADVVAGILLAREAACRSPSRAVVTVSTAMPCATTASCSTSRR